MTDYSLKVTANTTDAQEKLDKVDKAADKATRSRKLDIDLNGVNTAFKNLNTGVSEASNNIKSLYGTLKMLPGIGDPLRDIDTLLKGIKNAPAAAVEIKKASEAGNILATSMNTAGKATVSLIDQLSRVGFALFAVKETVGVLQSAFSGFFDNTIGREIQLRETMLKTQTTLASTNRVFKDGKEITDPYQKIVSLTGEIEKRIDSIRERTIELAGVTSNDVIEVFGIVASQIGQVGGGLKEAEDMAVGLAAALGTFGLPLEQARQEIGSMLRGDINMDSYLAKSLGITNRDIQDARSKAGGVIKFVNDKLAAAVAGQKIAAEGFRGVMSNIMDLWELVNQRFGAGLLDPMLDGLSSTFEFLFKIREQVFAIAEGAGRAAGRLASVTLGRVSEGSTTAKAVGGPQLAPILDEAKSALGDAVGFIQSAIQRIMEPLTQVFDGIVKSIATVAAGLMDLAKAFISLQVGNIKVILTTIQTLIPVVTSLATAFSYVLSQYGQLLKLPLVQYITQLNVQFGFLRQTGLNTITTIISVGTFLVQTWKPIIPLVGMAFTAIKAGIASTIGLIASAIRFVANLVKAFLALIQSFAASSAAAATNSAALAGNAAAMQALALKAQNAANSVNNFGKGVNGVNVKKFILENLAMSGGLLALQLVLTVVIDLIGRYQQRLSEIAQEKRALEALKDLKTVYKDVGDESTTAEKRAKAFSEGLVTAQIDVYTSKLNEQKEKLKELQKDYKNTTLNIFGLKIDNKAIKGFIEDTKKEIAKNEAKLKIYDAEQDKKNLEANINIQAQQNTSLFEQIKKQRKQLEDSIGDQRRSLENAVFQKQQETRQKEIENARAAGDLRIQAVERANIKMLEGEQGSSRAALEAVVAYLSTKKKGELDIELARKSMQLEFANMEKALANFKIDTERQIYNMRIAVGEYEKQLEQFKTNQEQLRSDIRKNDAADGAGPGGVSPDGTYVQGNIGPTSTGDHFHIGMSGGGNYGRKALDQYVRVNGGPLSAGTTVAGGEIGDPRDYGGHAGRDYAFGKGAALTLANGAKWVSNKPGTAHGDETAFMTPDGKVYKILHGKFQPANPAAAGANPAGAGANDDFTTRYFKRLSNLEGGYGLAGSKAFNPTSGASGYFQVIPSTRRDLINRGKTDILNQMMSSDFATAMKGAKRYAMEGKPELEEMFATGNRAGLDKALNRKWTSLPGGQEEAIPTRMASANRYLATTSTAARATATVTAPTAPTFDASVGEKAIAGMNEAMASFKGAMERSRQIQAEISKATTAKAFEDIAKAAFPEVNLEQYRDQNIQLDETLNALNALKGEQIELVTPEQLNLTAEYQKTLKVIAAERDEYVKGLDKLMAKPDNKMDKVEYDRLIKTFDEGRKKNAAGLEAEFTARTKIIDKMKEVKAVQDLVALAASESKKMRESEVETLTKTQTILAGNNIYLQKAATLEGFIAKLRTDPAAAKALDSPVGKEALAILKKAGEADAKGDIAEELARLKYDATTGNSLMLKGARASAIGQRSAAYSENDFYGKRLSEAELKITERRLDLEAKGLLTKENEIAEFKAFSDATRNSAAALAQLDKETAAFMGSLALIRNVSRSIVDGQKNFIKTALTGGDMGQAMEDMLRGLSDTILNSVLDAAFKPVEKMLEDQFKKIFGLQDPVKLAQEQNTVALKELTTAITTAATTSAGAVGTVGAAALPANGIVPFTPGSADTGLFSPGTSVIDTSAATAATAGSTTGFPELKTATQEATAALKETATSAAPVPQTFSKFQQTMGGVVSALAGVGMGFAGMQQMKKGGTYNTLMGLAGIFGGIASIGSTFMPGGGLGKLFGGARASGGPVSANRPYLVGEQGPELFTPGASGNITSNDDLFKSTRSALGGNRRSSPEGAQAMAAAGPIDIRFESRTINSVEYVTADQHRKGMQQAAERGRSLAFEGLQRSVSVRRRLGI